MAKLKVREHSDLNPQGWMDTPVVLLSVPVTDQFLFLFTISFFFSHNTPIKSFTWLADLRKYVQMYLYHYVE